MTSQAFNHTHTVGLHTDMHAPDAYAASAAVSHSLTALAQANSKRLHSSCLSLICRHRGIHKTRVSVVYEDLYVCCHIYVVTINKLSLF